MTLNFAVLANQQETLILDLPHPLPIDPEFFANFLQRVLYLIPHARAHPKDMGGAIIEPV